MAVGAALSNRVGSDQKQIYLGGAQTAWAWFQKVGFINSRSLINDGISNTTCTNQGNQPLYTYNQGVILGALSEMYRATGETSYLDHAEAIADAAITIMVDSNGILADSCDATASCSGDGIQFKGVFPRNLQRLYAQRPKATWQAWLQKQAQTIWTKDTEVMNGACYNGPGWDGPFYTPDGSPDASSQSSALDALNAALAVSS